MSEFDIKTIATISFSILAIGLLSLGILNLNQSNNNENKKQNNKKQKNKQNEIENNNNKKKNIIKEDIDKDIDNDNENNTIYKGYKKTSTGKTTTYFNRELTKEEKDLLGDITPKKIDSNNLLTPQNVNGSAWNSAGTYEEKNIIEWSEQTLHQKISKVIHYINQKNGEQIIVTNISKIEGDSTVSVIRGKKKFLYDLTVTLDWKLTAISPTLNKNIEVTGKMTITDITAEHSHEFQISEIISSSSSQEVNPLVQKYIKSSSSNSFQSTLSATLLRFYEDMKLNH